jgi:hypothetical protein
MGEGGVSRPDGLFELAGLRPPLCIQIQQRSVLGGVRKAPGGGSTLTMQDYHPATPAAGARRPEAKDHSRGGAKGGESTFKFGW